MRAHIVAAVIVFILAIWAGMRLFGHFHGGGASGAAAADAQALYEQGRQEYLHGNNAKAVELGQRAIAEDPNQPDFYNMEARALFLRKGAGDIQAGEQCLMKAINLNPNEAKYWENLARGLAEELKYTEAKQALAKAMECNPSSDRAAEIQEYEQQIDQQIAAAQQASGS